MLQISSISKPKEAGQVFFYSVNYFRAGIITERGSTPGTGTRPFGQPLCLTVTQENGDDLPPTPPPPSPSIFKNKQQTTKKVVKAKK